MMFDTFEKALLRNPIFPLTTLFNQNGETLDLDILAKEFLSNKVFLEAVFWSSTTFYKVLLDYSDGKITDEKKKRKVSNTLKKYIIRYMAAFFRQIKIRVLILTSRKSDEKIKIYRGTDFKGAAEPAGRQESGRDLPGVWDF